jgi:hypothetical protein
MTSKEKKNYLRAVWAEECDNRESILYGMINTPSGSIDASASVEVQAKQLVALIKKEHERLTLARNMHRYYGGDAT